MQRLARPHYKFGTLCVALWLLEVSYLPRLSHSLTEIVLVPPDFLLSFNIFPPLGFFFSLLSVSILPRLAWWPVPDSACNSLLSLCSVFPPVTVISLTSA